MAHQASSLHPPRPITLTPEEDVALTEALETLKWDHPRDRRFLARLAIQAVCMAIVRDGRMIMPLAVNLRGETRDETNARLICLKVGGGQ